MLFVVLDPTKQELPMLEDPNYNETEKQLEFLGQMPPRVSRGADKKFVLDVVDGAGSSRGGDAQSAGRSAVRSRLVDEEDVGFGVLNEAGDTVAGTSAGMVEMGSPSTSEEVKDEAVSDSEESVEDAEGDPVTEVYEEHGGVDSDVRSVEENVVADSPE